jgi:aryl-alcohol dehydrogenase-like predicted oxidoreductase
VDSGIESIILGRTGKKVSRVGLGGEGILRTYGRADEAALVLETAYASGITYYDSARAYSGSEEYYGQFWKEHAGWKGHVFQTSKSAERTYRAAMDDLAHTLQVMNREYLDLWQIHDLRTGDELRLLNPLAVPCRHSMRPASPDLSARSVSLDTMTRKSSGMPLYAGIWTRSCCR